MKCCVELRLRYYVVARGLHDIDLATSFPTHLRHAVGVVAVLVTAKLAAILVLVVAPVVVGALVAPGILVVLVPMAALVKLVVIAVPGVLLALVAVVPEIVSLILVALE